MTRAANHSEREIKLDAGALGEPLASALFDGMDVISDETVTLRADYWDTKDLRLVSWGHELRYRVASDGGEAAWTVKFAAPDGDDGVLSRQELEFPGDGQSPPVDVRRVVMAFTAHEALVPVATLTTDRHRVRLRATDGTVVEVSEDQVTSRVGRGIGPRLHELEVELIEGSAARLRDVAAKLCAAGARKGTSKSKIARVAADRPAGTTTRRLQRRELASRSTIGELVCGAVTDGTLRLLAHDPGLRTGDDPEAVHQARVATRRLRSDLKTLEPLLVEGRVEALRSELRWLGRLLGAVRDVDVLAGHLEQVAADAGDSDGAKIRGLVERLHIERTQRMLELRDVLTSDRYVTLVEDLVRTAHTPPYAPGVDVDAPAGDLGRRVAAHAWKRTERRVRRLGPRPSEVALHEVRRRAKRARYAVELVAPVVGGREPRQLAKRLGDVQDVLGELQDTVVAVEWLRREADGTVPAGQAFAAGLLVRDETDRRRWARRKWKPEWRRAARPKLRHWMS